MQKLERCVVTVSEDGLEIMISQNLHTDIRVIYRPDSDTLLARRLHDTCEVRSIPLTYFRDFCKEAADMWGGIYAGKLTENFDCKIYLQHGKHLDTLGRKKLLAYYLNKEAYTMAGILTRHWKRWLETTDEQTLVHRELHKKIFSDYIPERTRAATLKYIDEHPEVVRDMVEHRWMRYLVYSYNYCGNQELKDLLKNRSLIRNLANMPRVTVSTVASIVNSIHCFPAAKFPKDRLWWEYLAYIVHEARYYDVDGQYAWASDTLHNKRQRYQALLRTTPEQLKKAHIAFLRSNDRAARHVERRADHRNATIMSVFDHRADLGRNATMVAVIEDSIFWHQNRTRLQAEEQACKDARLIEHDFAYPPIPLPKMAGIEFIDQGRRLVDEGLEMHHCVGSYVDQCRRGQSYIFAYKDPQTGKRATAEVNRQGKVTQSYGPHDQHTPEADKLRRILAKWVEDWPQPNAEAFPRSMQDELAAIRATDLVYEGELVWSLGDSCE